MIHVSWFRAFLKSRNVCYTVQQGGQVRIILVAVDDLFNELSRTDTRLLCAVLWHCTRHSSRIQC